MQGVVLTRLLLYILTLSILVLMVYLWLIDAGTSQRVDQLYTDAFTAIENRGMTPLFPKLDATIATLRTLETEPDRTFPKDTADQTKADLAEIAGALHLEPQARDSLVGCAVAVHPSTERRRKIPEASRTNPALRPHPIRRLRTSGPV